MANISEEELKKLFSPFGHWGALLLQLVKHQLGDSGSPAGRMMANPMVNDPLVVDGEQFMVKHGSQLFDTEQMSDECSDTIGYESIDVDGGKG